MRTPTKSKSSLRNRALAACLAAALVAPAAASAMPQQSSGPAQASAPAFPLPPVHRDVPGTDPAAAAPSAIRVVRTVNVTNSSNTLPIVLAAAALAIALTGAAYVTLRVRPALRS
jgi:hypothetical protein